MEKSNSDVFYLHTINIVTLLLPFLFGLLRLRLFTLKLSFIFNPSSWDFRNETRNANRWRYHNHFYTFIKLTDNCMDVLCLTGELIERLWKLKLMVHMIFVFISIALKKCVVPIRKAIIWVKSNHSNPVWVESESSSELVKFETMLKLIVFL